jgi:APA family basic amino acid/polyamine antiporter
LDLGRRFQVLMTLFKVLFILIFVAAGLFAPAATGALSALPAADSVAAVLSPAFGLSLIYVTYAYSGWNAAVYVAAEVRDPQRQVPRALILGTLTVTALYLALNLVFLRTVSLEALAGTVEVGASAAVHIFGIEGGRAMSAALSLLLLSTISAMVLAGPRVIEVMAAERPRLRLFSARTRRGAPARAVALQIGIAIVLILTDSFAAVLGFAGFTLTLFALLTVLGVSRLRRLEPDLPRPFRVPWYPLPPILFALPSITSLLVVGWENPLPVVAGMLLLSAWWLMLRGGARAGATRL